MSPIYRHQNEEKKRRVGVGGGGGGHFKGSVILDGVCPPFYF